MNNISSMEWWLSDLRGYFIDTSPALVSLYDTYAAEALFGRHFIASDLKDLQPGAKILEVGAGSMLLSCQLVREGFQIIALEPIGPGFSHFTQMRQIVLARATALQCLPISLDVAAEEFTENNVFDYAFSINVMEHVLDIAKVISNIANSLKEGANYHFTTPNYLFPYEPHFNIPTLFSKRITEKVFKKKIFGNKKMSHPEETWKSLNWINTLQIRKIGWQFPELKTTFNRSLLVIAVERIASDPVFASRRSPLIKKILLFLMKYRLHKLLRFIPVELQPIIDCRLQKNTDSGRFRWHR